MVIVYILIAIALIALGVYWVRLERQKGAEEVSDKVEPDLNDLFTENTSAERSLHEETSSMNNLENTQKAIDHDDLSYRPKAEAQKSVEEVVAPVFQEREAEIVEETVDTSLDTPMEAPTRDFSSPVKSGFFQKVLDLFRGKKQKEMAIYSDDGNLMRPASVETVALILSAAPDQPYSFKEILAVAHELDLRVENGGFIQLLTTTHYGDEPMYSIGHLLGEGIFDEDLVRYHLDDTTPGLIFFSKIPGPDPDISTIEQLLAGIHHFSMTLGGTILDTNQKPMSKDDLIELFHKTNKTDNEEWERAYEAYEQRNR